MKHIKNNNGKRCDVLTFAKKKYQQKEKDKQKYSMKQLKAARQLIEVFVT